MLMRLPVRMVPAESWPLAFDSRSIPSMTSSLDLCGSSGASGQTAPDVGSVKVRSKLGLGVRAAHRPGFGGDAVRVVHGHEAQRRRLAGRVRDRVLERAQEGQAGEPAPTARRNDRRAAEVLARLCSLAPCSARRSRRSSRTPPASRSGCSACRRAAAATGGHEVVLGAPHRRVVAPGRSAEQLAGHALAHGGAAWTARAPGRCCRRSRRRDRCPCPPRWSSLSTGSITVPAGVLTVSCVRGRRPCRRTARTRSRSCRWSGGSSCRAASVACTA